MSPLISKLSRLACLGSALAALPLFLAASEAPAVSLPRFTHPGAGQTFYFVLTDRFANGRTNNDQGGLTGGPEITGFDPTKISHYHGGDFVGMTARLDYLKRLGITAVWVTPPFKNKAMQQGTAGYHGYWITDFLQIDPHLGTNAEFTEFIKQAHARGIRVYMDIIANHTADVINYKGGDTSYKSMAEAPYRDASGKAFDPRKVAYNGANDASSFPALSPEKSFAYQPVVPETEKSIKNPAWLNDVTLYHNRGNSAFKDESSIHGDFVGLDDLLTEHPTVVKGMADIYGSWLATGIDGFRIDTVRHVNSEFWQGFIPAIREKARALGRPDFIQFGEVANETMDLQLLSEFSTEMPLDATLDFGFFVAARNFVSQHGTAAALADFFSKDDLYTDHDSSIHSSTTFLGNHDAGRFGYFLQQDNPGASPDLLLRLSKLGHGLLLLSRGQPVLYYGDEQGMVGRGGNDMQARESLFPAQAPDFRDATLLGTKRTGADDKFDEKHPLFTFIAKLDALRAANKALRTGTHLTRLTRNENIAAFSRIDRQELVEYLVVLNSSRTQTLRTAVPTSQHGQQPLIQLFDSRSPEKAGGKDVQTDAEGQLQVELAPLQFAVFKAKFPLAKTGPVSIALSTPSDGSTIKLGTREVDGLLFPTRQAIQAEVSGGDGVAEVTFMLRRSSRPNQLDYLGTDDTPPYRIFWRPPTDLQPDEALDFIATVNDLRGLHKSASLSSVRVSPDSPACGIRGATTPIIATLGSGKGTVTVTASGTAPLEYQWYLNGEEILGADKASFIPAKEAKGELRVLVRNRAGSVLSNPIQVGR